MSEQNVEVVRQGWEAWFRGDFQGLFRHFDPEIVWDLSHFHDWPESSYHQIEGVERFLTEWLEVWDQYEVRIDEVLGAPDGRVVTLLWQRGQGRDSGLPLDMEMAQVASFRDGKITRLAQYEDRNEALEAVGLGAKAAG